MEKQTGVFKDAGSQTKSQGYPKPDRDLNQADRLGQQILNTKTKTKL